MISFFKTKGFIWNDQTGRRLQEMQKLLYFQIIHSSLYMNFQGCEVKVGLTLHVHNTI